jgi:protein associated with RNAse G/E
MNHQYFHNSMAFLEECAMRKYRNDGMLWICNIKSHYCLMENPHKIVTFVSSSHLTFTKIIIQLFSVHPSE